MTTFERLIEYGKRRTAELEAVMADPDAAKKLHDAVTNGNALLSLLAKRASVGK